MNKFKRFRGKTLIRVNQQAIRGNQQKKHNDHEKVITVTYPDGSSVECNHVEIRGSSTVVYCPDNAIEGGARVWMETYAAVVTNDDTEKDWQ